MTVPSLHDLDILRRLAECVAAAAADPHQHERATLWRRTNDLDPVRPVVLIYQIPWPEMDTDGELCLQTRHPWAREVEQEWRRALYQWDHLRADMVVDGCLRVPVSVNDTGFGIDQRGETRETGSVTAQQYEAQLHDEADLEKIQHPRVHVDNEETAARLAYFEAAVGDILPVRLHGISRIWFAPWDELIRWYGIGRLMTDLLERPDFVNTAISRLVDAWMARLDQYIGLGLLEQNGGSDRIGSGGLGFTGALPAPQPGLHPAQPGEMWGCAAAQIFSDVSPGMHEEFALRHELRWLERFGLNYYGCCEPLHRKLGILRKIPRLRKVSISPWADVAEAVSQGAGSDLVLSIKPSPAIMAESTWDPARARAQLECQLRPATGLAVEVILKDISTVAGEPRRLWDWARMAMEVVEGMVG